MNKNTIHKKTYR